MRSVMKRPWLIAAVLLLLLAVAIWYQQQPVTYTLHINNKSGLPVDKLSLLDSGVMSIQSIEGLANDGAASLQVVLKEQGVLRFQVEQGMNRLDGILERDVSRPLYKEQHLVVHPNNRLILSQRPD